VWQDIYASEKMNFPLFLPEVRKNDRYCLWHVIEDGIREKAIFPYEALYQCPTCLDKTQADNFPPGGSSVTKCTVNPAMCKFIPQQSYPLDPSLQYSYDGRLWTAAGEVLLDVDKDTWPDSWETKDAQGNIVPAKGNPNDHKDVFGNPYSSFVDVDPTVTGTLAPESKGCPTKMEMYTAKDIVGYRLKEEWIFDKQKSMRLVRIIGLAPLVAIDPANQQVLQYYPNEEVRPLFWLHYPSCRIWFSSKDVFNMNNQANRNNYDDIFEMRKFSAHVIKEDNDYDRKIQEYAQGIDALMEGERVKKEIFEFEHDLWNY